MIKVGKCFLIAALAALIIIGFFMAFACSDSGNSDDDDDNDDETNVDDDDTNPDDDDTNPDDDETPDDDDDAVDDDIVELSWVYIPADTFLMGCVEDDTLCDADETPQHEVSIENFEMTATEITQGQYEAVIGENAVLSGNYEENEIGDDFPVFNVTWAQAKAFCEAVGGRLPTETEWEFTARSGNENWIYICGDDSECLDEVAWYLGTSLGSVQKTKEKKPNAFGLHDMSGNVAEWVNDYYLADYYSISPSENPIGPGTGNGRVVRGGNYLSDVDFIRLSNRTQTDESAVDYIGFRCARSTPD